MARLFLLRYDTEAADPKQPDQMAGFFEKAVEVHRRHAIPATFFCCGRAIDARENAFRNFYEEVKDDPLFDIQDHSYTHIGVCYERGPEVDVLRADYEKSFAAHARVFGVRPCGVSICGTSGRDGPALPGFDATEKSRQEFEMLVGLGVRMINTRLSTRDTRGEFCNYAALDHPEVMGFPSGHSDTGWMYQRPHGDPIAYIDRLIRERAAADQHMPLMLHDWCAWTCADDKELSHVAHFADTAREVGYKLVAHMDCLRDPSLWR